MRIGFNKKNLIVLISLFVLSLVLLIGGYLLLKGEEISLLKSPRLGNSYEDFAKYCSKEKNSSEIFCKAFIVNTSFEDMDEDAVCFDLLVYDGAKDVENMMLCGDPSSFDWDNPYGDYEKYVPVFIEMSISKSFLGSSKLGNAKFILMEDQEMFDILDTLPEDQGRGSEFQSLIYIKEHQEIFDKGYYINSPIGTDTRNHLILYDAEVKKVFPREGEVSLLLSTRIYGEELSLLVSTEEFEFARPAEAEEGILIDVEKLDFFEKDGNFFLIFDFGFTLEEVEVEEYLKSLLELEEEEIVLKEEFNLTGIVAKEI